MKICPVCNETFANELRFCDLDGTKLKHQPGTEAGSSQGRVWSLLGVGVLLGALVIATLSIIFNPKPSITPSLASATPASSTEQSPPADPAASVTQAESTPSTEQPPIVVAETAPIAAKKKEKAPESLDPNASLPPLNPKDAAQPDEATAKSAAKTEEDSEADSAEPKKVETAPVIKPVSNPRESEASPKSATAAEAKKEKKSANPKDADKDSNPKKSKDEEKEKKKGGFLRVFKKIFGKG